MSESGRAKVKELLVRHSELEQSETKAQAALVTILSLTQITELKLLLDIGRQGHRFYDFVLTLLIASISLEICVGIIIIYIGNLHYYRSSTSSSSSSSSSSSHNQRENDSQWNRSLWTRCLTSCSCCQSCRFPSKTGSTSGGAVSSSTAYQTVREAPITGETPIRSASEAAGLIERSGRIGGGSLLASRTYDWVDVTNEPGIENLVHLERADITMEMAKVRVADADVRIVRATNYARVVEEALRKTPGTGGSSNTDLEAELDRARDDITAASRERAEGEAEQRLAKAHQRHAIFVREMEEDRMESSTFRKVALWQHVATYLLYFVMLMNVFVTTFGISGGSASVFTGGRMGSNPSASQSSGALTHTAPILLPVDGRHTGY